MTTPRKFPSASIRTEPDHHPNSTTAIHRNASPCILCQLITIITRSFLSLLLRESANLERRPPGWQRLSCRTAAGCPHDRSPSNTNAPGRASKDAPRLRITSFSASWEREHSGESRKHFVKRLLPCPRAPRRLPRPETDCRVQRGVPCPLPQDQRALRPKEDHHAQREGRSTRNQPRAHSSTTAADANSSPSRPFEKSSS